MSHLSIDINADGDLYIKNGNLAMARDIEALAGVCTQVASARRGEILFYDSRGIPFFETVWEGVPNIAQFQAAVSLALMGIDGVVSIPEFIAVTENGEAKYGARVQTIYGEVNI